MLAPAGNNASRFYDFTNRYAGNRNTNAFSGFAALDTQLDAQADEKDENAPLTEAEIALARQHLIYQEINRYLKLGIAASIGTEEERAAALEEKEAMRERYGQLKASGAAKMTAEYGYHAFGFTICTAEQMDAQMAEMMSRKDNFGRELYQLPQQRYSFDAAANAIKIGVGSKIPIDGYQLWVFKGMVGAVHNGSQPPTDIGPVTYFSNTSSPYTEALDGLLRAVGKGQGRWAQDGNVNGKNTKTRSPCCGNWAWTSAATLRLTTSCLR